MSTSTRRLFEELSCSTQNNTSQGKASPCAEIKRLLRRYLCAARIARSDNLRDVTEEPAKSFDRYRGFGLVQSSSIGSKHRGVTAGPTGASLPRRSLDPGAREAVGAGRRRSRRPQRTGGGYIIDLQRIARGGRLRLPKGPAIRALREGSRGTGRCAAP